MCKKKDIKFFLFPNYYYLCSRKWKKSIGGRWFRKKHSTDNHNPARVAKLVDAPDLGSGVLRCAGSSPVRRTTTKKAEWIITSVRPFLFQRPPIVATNPPKIRRKPKNRRKSTENPPFVLNHRDKEEKRFMDLKSRSQMTENAEFPCSSCHAQPPKNSKCLGIHSLT